MAEEKKGITITTEASQALESILAYWVDVRSDKGQANRFSNGFFTSIESLKKLDKLPKSHPQTSGFFAWKIPGFDN